METRLMHVSQVPISTDAAIARGIADAEAGRVMPLEEAFARIRKELGLPDEDHDQ